jgi:hypothetical protein
MKETRTNYPELKHTSECHHCGIRVDDGKLFCEPRCERLYGEERARGVNAKGREGAPQASANVTAPGRDEERIQAAVRLIHEARAAGVEVTLTPRGTRLNGYESLITHWAPRLRASRDVLTEAALRIRGDRIVSVDL